MQLKLIFLTQNLPLIRWLLLECWCSLETCWTLLESLVSLSLAESIIQIRSAHARKQSIQSFIRSNMQEIWWVLLLLFKFLVFLCNVNLFLLHCVEVKKSFKAFRNFLLWGRLEWSKLILHVLLLHVWLWHVFLRRVCLGLGLRHV